MHMAAPAVPQKTPSVWEDFIDIFVSPSAVFARREKANFFLPMVVVTIVITLLYLGTKSLMQPVFDAEFSRQMAKVMQANPQVTSDQMEKGRAIAENFGFLFVLIGLPIAIIFTGMLLWLVGKLFDATLAFGAALLIAAYAAFPRILQTVAQAVIAYFTDPSKLDAMAKVTASPAHFLSTSTTSPLVVALVQRLDVFTIWCTILLGIGLAVIGKIPRSRAFAAAAIVWVLATVYPVYQALRLM
jgi:hypothetical protein